MFLPVYLSLVSLAIIAWDIATWQQRGWTGITTKWEVVDFIFADSPAQKAGIAPGDTILAINGMPVDSIAPIIRLAAQTKVGEKYTYLIERDGRQLSFTVTPESPFQVRQVVVTLVSALLVGLVFLIIGYFVYIKQPDDRRARIFCLMSIFAAAFFIMNSLFSLDWYGTSILGLASITSPNILTIAGMALTSFFFALLLIHLVLIFPKDRPVVRNSPQVFLWLYGLPTLWSFPLAIAIVIVLAEDVGNSVPVSKYSIGYLTGYMLVHLTKTPVELFNRGPIFAVIALGLFLYLLQRSKKAREAEGLKRWIWMRPLQSMFLIALLTFALIGGSFAFIALFNPPKIIAIIFRIIFSVVLWGGAFIMSLIYPIIPCVLVYRSYQESNVEEKRQVKWPLWGIFLALVGYLATSILGTMLVTVLGRSLNAVMFTLDGVLVNALYLIIPISFAFAILKYRLMDIDLIIKKTIIYTLLTGIIVALYFSLAGGLGGLLVKFTGVESTWITIFSTLIIAALFMPVRNRVQNVVDRRFFRKKYDYPTALRTLSREISQVVELQALLKLSTEHLQPALQNRSVVIFGRGTYDRAYVATAKVGLPDEILGQLKFEVDSRLLTMMDSPFEVHTQDLPEVEKLTLRKAGGAFIVPVKLKNELVGFISLGTKLSDEDYDAEDKDFLTSVAEQMAVGFDRVRLREQERDFEKAREIQQGLLPKQIPQMAGYEIACAWQPARAVAGDYYDVIKLSESALGICIADVVGKGMPAALLMSNLQAIVRAVASEDMPPKQLCEKVNKVISSNMTPGKFITFFYCSLDAQKKKLVYTNAGHNRPILFHQDGMWIELKEGGLALGMSRERNYEQGEVGLKSGDRILLFTDGVTEVTNAEGEAFDEHRIIDLLGKNRELGAGELQKKILEAVTQFSNSDFQDDVTLMAISVA